MTLKRRAFSLFAGLSVFAAAARGDVQTAGSTNGPHCPVCRSHQTESAGYLLTSTDQDAVRPVCYPAAAVNICQGCGAMFAAAAPVAIGSDLRRVSIPAG